MNASASRRVLAFPVALAAPVVPEKDLQALLAVWTPREFFRFAARHSYTLHEALRERWKCVRCRSVNYLRLRKIALEEFGRLRADAEEPRPMGLRRAHREEVLS